MRVLVIEDNATISETIADGLSVAKMIATEVADGRHADTMLYEAQKNGRQFDVIVLDLTLPGMDGLQVLRQLRARNDMTPVLVLTARSSLVERVSGLDIGADDYLAKPFDITELIARLRVLGRRHQGWESMAPSLGNLIFNATASTFCVNSQILELTPRAQAVLEALFRRQGSTVSNDYLTNMDRDGSSVEAVNIQISRLRKKLAESGATVTIRTRYGTGYALVANGLATAVDGGDAGDLSEAAAAKESVATEPFGGGLLQGQ